MLMQAELAASAQKLSEDWNRNAVAVDMMVQANDFKGDITRARANSEVLQKRMSGEEPWPRDSMTPGQVTELMREPPVPVLALPPSKAYLWSRSGADLQYMAELGDNHYLDTEEAREAISDPNSMSPDLSDEQQEQLIFVEKVFRTALAYGDEKSLISMMKRMAVPLAPGAKPLYEYYKDIMSDPKGFQAQVGLTGKQMRAVEKEMENHMDLIHAIQLQPLRGEGQRSARGLRGGRPSRRSREQAKKKLEEWTWEEAKLMSGPKAAPQDIKRTREALRSGLGFTPTLDQNEAQQLLDVYKKNPAMWIPGWMNRLADVVPMGGALRGALKESGSMGAQVLMGWNEAVYGVSTTIGDTLIEAGTFGFAPGSLLEKWEQTSKDINYLEQELPAPGKLSAIARMIGRELPYLAASLAGGQMLRASTGWQAFTKARPVASRFLGPAIMSSFSSLPRFPQQVADRTLKGQDLDTAIYGALFEQASEIGMSALFQQTGIEGILNSKPAKEVIKQSFARGLARAVPGVTTIALFEGLEEMSAETVQMFAEKLVENDGDIPATIAWAMSPEGAERVLTAGGLGAFLGGGVSVAMETSGAYAESRDASREAKNLRESAVAREAKKQSDMMKRAADWGEVMGPELRAEIEAKENMKLVQEFYDKQAEIKAQEEQQWLLCCLFFVRRIAQYCRRQN